jgi:hypothetical protein
MKDQILSDCEILAYLKGWKIGLDGVFERENDNVEKQKTLSQIEMIEKIICYFKKAKAIK